ncbi:glycosidase [Planctomycetota bacterium]
MERQVDIDGISYCLDLNDPVARYINPILTAGHINEVWTSPSLQVKTVHNAGVATFKDQTVMLFRSHLRNGISVIGLARSNDGLTQWTIAPRPAMIPASKDDVFVEGANKEALIENESGGVEDPRITKIDDTYLITYSAYHASIKDRVRVSLVSTTDFVTYLRHGPVLDKDMRNVVIFPERIAGKYVGLFRPNDDTEGDVGGAFAEIRMGTTPDWRTGVWDIFDEPLMRTGGGPSAFQDKIGPGAPPIRTRHGWINIFHGVRSTMDGNPYTLGCALHDISDPSRVRVSDIPILFPSKADCRVDDTDYIHVPNVVFTCAAIRRDDGSVLIYYGGNDTVMNIGISHEDVLAELCMQYGQDPLQGTPLYDLI